MATATTTTQSSLPAGYSASDLVFNDDFSGTTLDRYWNTYITSNAATVTATDQTSNSSSAAQSIAVTDPAFTSATGTSGSGSTGSGSTTTSGSGSSSQHSWGHWGGGNHSNVSQWFDSHPGFATTAKTLSDAFSSKSGASSAAGHRRLRPQALATRRSPCSTG
jgi:hypothetical protein